MNLILLCVMAIIVVPITAESVIEKEIEIKIVEPVKEIEEKIMNVFKETLFEIYPPSQSESSGEEFTDLYEKYSVNYKINNEFVEKFAKLIINNISDLNKLLIHKNILDKNIICKKNNSLRMTLYEL
jgi:hypothetical protein